MRVMGSNVGILDFLVLIVGVGLTLRAVVRMYRCHLLRVVVLTVIFFCAVFYIYATIGVLPEPAGSF
jgi:hypothetical protein